MNPKVSLIIPVYNGENCIERCFLSLIKQSYKNIEIILINDGSNDNSKSICDRLAKNYKNQGIEIIVIHQKNQGVSKTRNLGIQIASGDYFACIDCDDAVTPSYLEDMIELLNSHQELVHVCCGFRSMANNKDYLYSEKELFSIVERKQYMDLFEKIVVQSPCLRLYKTDVVKNNNLKMKENLSLGEDLIFNLEYFDALGNGKYGIVNKANYIYYDIGENSLNRKYRKDLADIYSIIHSNLKYYLKKWDAYDQTAKIKYYNYVLINYFNIFENTFDKHNTMSVINKIKYNDKMIKSSQFQKALKYKSVKLPKYLEIAYTTGKYEFVLIIEKIYKLKQLIRRVK